MTNYIKQTLLPGEYTTFLQYWSKFSYNPVEPFYTKLLGDVIQMFYNRGLNSEYLADHDFIERNLILHKLADNNVNYHVFLKSLKQSVAKDRNAIILEQLFSTDKIVAGVKELKEKDCFNKESQVSINKLTKALAILKSQGVLSFYLGDNLTDANVTVTFLRNDFNLEKEIRILTSNQLHPALIFFFSEQTQDVHSLDRAIIDYVKHGVKECNVEQATSDILTGYKQCLTAAYYAQERYSKIEDIDFAIEQRVDVMRHKDGQPNNNTEAMDLFIAMVNYTERVLGDGIYSQLFSADRISTFKEVTTTSEF